MTEEELVEVAAKVLYEDGGEFEPEWMSEPWDTASPFAAKHFRVLARAVIAAVGPVIRAAERERCARIPQGYATDIGDMIAAAIRDDKRGET